MVFFFSRETIPFRRVKDFLLNVKSTVTRQIGTNDVTLQHKLHHFQTSEKPKMANLVNVIYQLMYKTLEFTYLKLALKFAVCFLS